MKKKIRTKGREFTRADHGLGLFEKFSIGLTATLPSVVQHRVDAPFLENFLYRMVSVIPEDQDGPCLTLRHFWYLVKNSLHSSSPVLPRRNSGFILATLVMDDRFKNILSHTLTVPLQEASVIFPIEC